MAGFILPDSLMQKMRGVLKLRSAGEKWSRCPPSAVICRIIYAWIDISGREVANIFNGNRKAGKYQLGFSTHSLKQGIYFYRFIYNQGEKVYSGIERVQVMR